jgi:peroxiredoxin
MMGRTISVCLVVALMALADCKRGGTSGSHSGSGPGITEIRGMLQEGAGREVVLEEMAAREYIPIDTVTCREDGSFQISFEPEVTAFYVLRIGPGGYITLLIEPGEKLTLKGNYGQPDCYLVEGSAGSELLMDLAGEHKQALEALARIARRNMELHSSPGYAQLKPGLDRQFDSITLAFHDYSLGFIERNQESLAILIALYNLYGQGLPVFHPEKDFQVYKFVDSALSARYSGFEAVELLHAQMLEAEVSAMKPQQLPGIKIGEIAPDFVSSRPDGQRMALSDLKGNYVLLAFWAGWSSVSREENGVLRQAWKKYRAMPFRILQVSFDGERSIWLKAIEEEGPEWDHVSDLRRWESPVADLYRVERIPSNYLIDPGGRVIGADLFGDTLIKHLDILFSHD